MLKTASGTVVLLSTLLLAPLSAAADTLVTGAIRDQVGTAIGGARVTALDSAGHIVGADIAVDDGTFVVDLPASATVITITCDYCQTVRRPLDATREPIVAIVSRFVHITQSGPSSADISALPYRSVADVASLLPLSVVRAGRVSDRGLDAYGATLVNGLPFYSPADGDNYSRLVPARAIAAIRASSPLVAPIYGGYAAAGVYDIALTDPDVTTSRIDAGNAFDLIGRTNATGGDAVYAVSNDSGNRRAAAGIDLGMPLAGGRLTFDTLAMGDGTSHASGAGIAYTTDTRRYATAASLRATQTGDASLVTIDTHVRNRGPIGLEFGLRATRATSDIAGNASAQADGAIYLSAQHQSRSQVVSADLALDTGSDSGYGGSMRATALVGSLGNTMRLGDRWSAHTGVVSNLRIPTFAESAVAGPVAFAGDRSLLFEQSIAYTDLRRLRLTGSAYTQRTTSAQTSNRNGIGIDASWQIAPRVSARTWLLQSNELRTPPVGAGPLAYRAEIAETLSRRLVWFTYDNGLRVDALVRSGAIEGSVRIPLGTTYAVNFGTAVLNAARVTTIGVTLR